MIITDYMVFGTILVTSLACLALEYMFWRRGK